MTPPSAAVAAVARYSHFRRPLPLLLPPLLPLVTAAAVVNCRLRQPPPPPAFVADRCRCRGRRRPLSPPFTATAAIYCRFRRPPPPPSAAPAAARICLQPLPLPPSSATATTDASVFCHRQSLLPPSNAASVDCRRRHPPWLTRVPTTTSFGGGGSGDQGNPGRACCNP